MEVVRIKNLTEISESVRLTATENVKSKCGSKVIMYT